MPPQATGLDTLRVASNRFVTCLNRRSINLAVSMNRE